VTANRILVKAASILLGPGSFLCSASTVSSALYSALLLFLRDGYRARRLLRRLFCQSQIAKALCLGNHCLACLF
jgi:hypothetical protein